MPEMNLGKYNERIAHLEQLRKEALHELCEFEDEFENQADKKKAQNLTHTASQSGPTPPHVSTMQGSKQIS